MESNPEMYHKPLNFKTRNQKHHLEGNAIPGIVTRMHIMQVELLTISTVTIFGTTLRPMFFALWKISDANS